MKLALVLGGIVYIIVGCTAPAPADRCQAKCGSWALVCSDHEWCQEYCPGATAIADKLSDRCQYGRPRPGIPW